MACFQTLSPIHAASGGITVFDHLDGHFGAVCTAPGGTFEGLAAVLAADGGPERVN